MLYPLVLSSHKRVIIVPQGWFDGIGSLDLQANELELAINRLGERGLAWFLTADGRFHELKWRGRIQKGLIQRIGLRRQREAYSVLPARDISCGKCLELIKDHCEQFEEAPNTQDLRDCLSGRPSDRSIDRQIMRAYLGE